MERDNRTARGISELIYRAWNANFTENIETYDKVVNQLKNIYDLSDQEILDKLAQENSLMRDYELWQNEE